MTEERGSEESKEVAGEESGQRHPPEQGNPTDRTTLMGSVPPSVHKDDESERTRPPGAQRDSKSE
jgi:hypothetical protein